MREITKPALMLFIITAISALCLGFVYEITKEPIEKAQAAEKTKAVAALLPQAAEFRTETEIPEDGLKIDDSLITEVLTAYSSAGNAEGYVISSECGGYAGPVGVLIAINLDGTIAGISIISSNETPGLGANASKEDFTGQYINKSGTLKVVGQVSEDNEIAAVTSATITSQSITNSVNAALKFFRENIKGGA